MIFAVKDITGRTFSVVLYPEDFMKQFNITKTG